MVFDEPIEVESAVFVPVKVRGSLQERLKSCTKIVIYENDGTKSRKINAISLNCKTGQYPQETVDEIAEAVTRVMHDAWSSQETEDPDAEVGLPPLDFTVVCEHWIQSGGGKKKRARHQFTFTYHADASEDFDEVNTDAESHATLQLLEHYKSLSGMLFSQVAESHERIIRNSEQQTASANAGAEMLREAIPMFLGGMQASLNAKYMEFNVHKSDLDALNQGKTLQTVMANVGPFLPILGMQILTKMGFDPGMVAGMMGGQGDEGDDDGPPPSSAGATADSAYAYNPGPPQPDEGGAPDEPSDADQGPQERLAMLAEVFGNSLSVNQQRELNVMLSKRQRALFDALFCAKTDIDAYSAYEAIVAGCMDKLVSMQKLLDSEQLKCLKMFMRAASKHKTEQDPGPKE